MSLTGGMPRTLVRGRAGFTIIELMIVVTIMGVLMAIGLPAFDDLIKNSRRTTVVNELISNLMLARAEAAKRGQPVTVCGNTSSGGVSCTGGATWDYGWMVFLDPDANGAIAATGDLLRRFVNDYSDIRVRTYTGGTGFLTLQPFNQAGTSGVVLICDKRGDAKSRRICVGSNGRANVSEGTCPSGEPTPALTCP